MVTNDVFMLVNPDITNNIFIGNDPGSQLIAVPALGSLSLNAKDHDIWVSTNGANYIVNAYLMPGGSNWVPSPAQVAAQINALGLATAANQGTQIGHESNTATNTNFTQLFLGGGFASALTSVAGTTISDDMKNAQKGVTTEISALIATGNAGGAPGGVPVLRGTANLGTASASTLNGNTTATLLSTVTVTKPSFEAIFQLNLPAAAGALPFASLVVQWTDSNTGLTVGQKTYILATGNGAGNALTYYLSGPCRGNQITLTLQNLETIQTLTYTWAFNQTSHVYTIDRLLQPSFPGTAPIGFTYAAGNPAKGALFLSQPSIGPNGTVTRLTAAHNAKAKISIDNGAQANGCAVVLQDPNNVYNSAATNQSFARVVAAAGQQLNQEIQFPNGPLLVNMINQAGTNTITPSVAIIAMEY
jgi:hypothetical protein